MKNMSKSPKVTVGLPVFNGERYLRISIESILRQTFSDFEFLIVDNASTDSTEQICREYAASDSRIRYCKNDINIGAPRNFNKVFSLSIGTYLKWSTADDYVAPDYIEKCLEVLERDSDTVLCYPRAILVDSEGRAISKYDDALKVQQPLASDRFIHLLSNIKLAHQHLGLIRTSALKRTSLHGTHIASDINFLAELSLFGKFYEFPEYLLFRRLHTGSSSWDRKSDNRQIEWCDPTRKKIRLDQWEANRCFFAAVRRSPTSFREKSAMYRYLCHRLFWQRAILYGDLVDAIRLVWGRISFRFRGSMS
jgi:glycosyltransferase involved in cell wall biosynthesis